VAVTVSVSCSTVAVIDHAAGNTGRPLLEMLRMVIVSLPATERPASTPQ